MIWTGWCQKTNILMLENCQRYHTISSFHLPNLSRLMAEEWLTWTIGHPFLPRCSSHIWIWYLMTRIRHKHNMFLADRREGRCWLHAWNFKNKNIFIRLSLCLTLHYLIQKEILIIQAKDTGRHLSQIENY